MLELAIRFDLRSPVGQTPHALLYPTAIEQAAWADRMGFTTCYLAEHHGATDGYLPAPFVRAGAMASRTRDIRFHFSAIIATIHNPVRLAEELSVLDNISSGRVEATFGIGYRPHEFQLFGVDKTKRARILEETIEICKAAWAGEEVTYNGVTLAVRPIPVQPGGPPTGERHHHRCGTPNHCFCLWQKTPTKRGPNLRRICCTRPMPRQPGPKNVVLGIHHSRQPRTLMN